MELTTLIFKHEFNQAKKWILFNQPNLNFIINQANTPLIAGKDSANIAMAEFLMNNGADPNFWDSGSNTPLIEAIETAV